MEIKVKIPIKADIVFQGFLFRHLQQQGQLGQKTSLVTTQTDQVFMFIIVTVKYYMSVKQLLDNGEHLPNDYQENFKKRHQVIAHFISCYLVNKKPLRHLCWTWMTLI